MQCRFQERNDHARMDKNSRFFSLEGQTWRVETRSQNILSYIHYTWQRRCCNTFVWIHITSFVASTPQPKRSFRDHKFARPRRPQGKFEYFQGNRTTGQSISIFSWQCKDELILHSLLNSFYLLIQIKNIQNEKNHPYPHIIYSLYQL